ncbi:MAG: hypothetical protein QXR60_01080 [Candidatus Nanoarchaeia archaeon]
MGLAEIVKSGATILTGTWDRPYVIRASSSILELATFQTEENVFTSRSRFPITVEYELAPENSTKIPRSMSFYVDCPGIKFTCKNLDMKIVSCVNHEDGLFRAVLNVKGLEQSPEATRDLMDVVEFFIEAEGKYRDMTGNMVSRGGLPKGTDVMKIRKDEYVIRYDFSSLRKVNIKTLWAGFKKDAGYKCDQEKYPGVRFFDKITCTNEETTKEEQKNEIKIQTQAVKEPQQKEQPKKTAEDIINEQPKNYRPLAVLSITLIIVLTVSGIILSYLYKNGYI